MSGIDPNKESTNSSLGVSRGHTRLAVDVRLVLRMTRGTFLTVAILAILAILAMDARDARLALRDTSNTASSPVESSSCMEPALLERSEFRDEVLVPRLIVLEPLELFEEL